MDSSATSKRKLLPFVPDVPYLCQGVFIFTFSYIWYTAFLDNYNDEYPADADAAEAINRKNWWRAIVGCILFLCSFSYLNPSDYAYFHPM